MGELHLDIIVDRMKLEFNVEANVGKPQVAYREAIRAKVTDIEGKHAKQSGGRGQYGHVVIDMYPWSLIHISGNQLPHPASPERLCS